jgi:glycosyltransferase involved in cell wall biosynthesis
VTYHVRVLAGRVDNTCGSHVYHRRLVQKLAARGHRVSLVCFQAVPEVLECAEVFEVPIEPHAGRRALWRFASWLQYRDCTRKLLRLGLPPADVVFCGEHLLMKGHWRLFPRTPWLYFPHAMTVAQQIECDPLPPVMRWVTTRVYTRLQHWGLGHADRTVRFTRVASDELAKRYGDGARLRFFVNPVGADLPEVGEKEGGRAEVRLLYVGQLIARKRLDTILSALSRLRHYAWSFEVVGDGELRERFEEQTRSLGLEGRVRFHGFQPDPAEWYRRADLLLLTSRSESLGLVLIEAMSYGVPCLAIRADGINYWNVNEEIISHGRTGLLGNGEEGFARELEAVLRRPEQLADLGRAARRRIAEHHTWDKHLERYEKLFDELVCAAGTRGKAHRVVVGNGA